MSSLVLHADDLGMNRAVNAGILRGFRHGLLTTHSLLANAPDAVWAIEQWKSLADEPTAGQLPSADARRKLGDPDCPFDLGVHLNLTQGRPLTGSRYPAELLDHEGRFPGVLGCSSGSAAPAIGSAPNSGGVGAASRGSLRPRLAADASQRPSIH